MAVQITIIGTGQIGASIGLALGEHKDMFVRVGHDKDLRTAHRAKELGAVDRVDVNLPRSVKDSSVIILALPLDQIQETLKFIALDLSFEAVIMDTAPVKAGVMQWMKEILPARRYYIGLAPVLNPAYLGAPGSGVEAARLDLFKHGLIGIVSPPGAPSETIKLAMDFSQLLGAEHLFIDPAELDSMMAATHILPQLMATALLNITVDQPGWRDARKLADRSFAAATFPLVQAGETHSLPTQAISAREHLLRWIDALVDNLDDLREQLASQEAEKLGQQIERARKGGEQWLKEKNTASWAAEEGPANVELPTAGQVFSRMFTFGGGRKPKPPK